MRCRVGRGGRSCAGICVGSARQTREAHRCSSLFPFVMLGFGLGGGKSQRVGETCGHQEGRDMEASSSWCWTYADTHGPAAYTQRHRSAARQNETCAPARLARECTRALLLFCWCNGGTGDLQLCRICRHAFPAGNLLPRLAQWIHACDAMQPRLYCGSGQPSMQPTMRLVCCILVARLPFASYRTEQCAGCFARVIPDSGRVGAWESGSVLADSTAMLASRVRESRVTSPYPCTC
jgi:hypothetical protein